MRPQSVTNHRTKTMKKPLLFLIFLVGLTHTFPTQDLMKPKLPISDDGQEHIGITKKTLNNYPGFTVPRPFAAFHPTMMKIMNQIIKDLKEKAVESPNYQPLKPFSPLNFRIIG